MVRKTRLHRRDWPRCEDLAAEGRTRRGIAASLGLLWSDFQRELKRSPQALLRLERGEAQHEQTLLDRLDLLSQIKGPAATTPLLFLLKSRHRWNDRPKQEHQPLVGVNLVLPAPMTPEQFQKALAAPQTEQITAEVTNDDGD